MSDNDTTPFAITRSAVTQAPLNPYLLATFRTLRKHADSGAFDANAALRLLKNNVRDIAPRNVRLSERDKCEIAERLLRFWRLTWNLNRD